MNYLRLSISVIAGICFFFLNVAGLQALEAPNSAKHSVLTQTLSTNQFEIRPAASEMKKGLLLFFMNPNGKPCQMQKEILEQSRGTIEQRYQIKYINATNPADRSYFYQFGVRGMPSIILLGSNGRIHHRFPPGILNRTQLLQAINKP